MHYAHIQVTPLEGPLGAEIGGVDLREPLSQDVRDEIEQAWFAHQLVVFRDQQLSAAQQATFCRQFGDLAKYPFMQPVEGNPNVIPIIKEPEAKLNFGGGWHTDSSYLPKPPKATVLFAVQVPMTGGDTLFANGYNAYERLSDEMKRTVDGKTGVFSAKIVHGSAGAYQDKDIRGQLGASYGGKAEDAEREVEHPLIRTHPNTGRKSIYCSLAHTHRIKGMSRDESLPIFQFLTKEIIRDDNIGRLKWRQGTLAMWDNRCLFHNAMNDYPGERRHMHRVIIEGEQPR